MNERDAKAVQYESSSGSNYYRERFTKVLAEIFVNCQDLITRKNSDYTKINQSDPFHNFRQEAIGMFLYNVSISDKVDDVTLGLLVRLNDKRRRRENLLLTSGSLVIDETITDTIYDEINYLAILLTHLTINGRHQIEKSEPDVKQITFEEQELKERNAQLVRVYEEMGVVKKQNEILYKELQEIKLVKKNVNRSKRSK